MKFAQIYTPVVHEDGTLLTQVSIEDEKGERSFCGFAEIEDKYGKTGSFTVDTWHRSQACALGRAVQCHRECGRVKVSKHSDGVSRVITTWL